MIYIEDSCQTRGSFLILWCLHHVSHHGRNKNEDVLKSLSLLVLSGIMDANALFQSWIFFLHITYLGEFEEDLGSIQFKWFKN